jgi:hypothetical protein
MPEQTDYPVKGEQILSNNTHNALDSQGHQHSHDYADKHAMQKS